VFRGNSPAKVDVAGRLKIPSGFKTLLDAANVKQLYITSMDGTRAQIWPLPEWEKREKVLMSQSALNESVESFLYTTSYYGTQVEMDSQARVMLPQKLRDTGIFTDVVVVGKVAYMEVLHEKDFEERGAGRQMSDEDRKAVLALISQVS
jgi:MraZ protein